MKPNLLSELAWLTLDSVDFAVRIIDTDETLIFYNRHSAKIIDRKSEYTGTDIHAHHQKSTNEKLDRMLQDFRYGRTEPFHYEARPYGKVISVTLSPLIKEGEFPGCV